MDPREFRNTLGTFATGVTVITVKGDNGESIGLTANAFSSLSLDPPLILVCLDKKSDSVPAFQKVVHLLLIFYPKNKKVIVGLSQKKAQINFQMQSMKYHQMACQY